MTSFFIAYPGEPPSVGQTIDTVKKAIEQFADGHTVTTWKRPDLSGQEIISPILDAIKAADVIVADITVPNFNVTYELGYALGLGKRGLPVLDRSFSNPLADIARAGIYDTLIYETYGNSDELRTLLLSATAGRRLATDFPYDPQPLYAVVPQEKTDDITKIMARSRRTGLRMRTFDPAEEPRLGASEAVRAVASSYGIVLPLLEPTKKDALAHNIRVAFVAGVAHALEKPTLILQRGSWPTPLDIRDEVKQVGTDAHLKEIFQDFAEEVRDAQYSSAQPKSSPTNKLATLNIGDPAAENEEVQLEEYFLERDEYRRVLKGEANVVVGRKGSGKTAVFLQTRDNLKSDRSNVVVDLSPEGFQLRRLKDLVLKWLKEGSKEHLLTAFWEYVLLLEICGKIIEKDREVHKRNHNLFDPYQRLLAHYRTETATEGLNFSARLLMLIERIAEKYQTTFGKGTGVDLKNEELTEVLYLTTLHTLRNEVVTYAKTKGEVLVLFDNIDKAWNASGLEESDVIMIRTLLDASRKLANDFRRGSVNFHCTIFLRNDIYDMLVSQTADRGKESTVLVDWVQPALLKQMIRQRLIFNSAEKSAPIEELWYEIAEPIVAGEDSLTYMIDRSLMRPRYLLRLINYCKGNATNFDRNRMDEDDFAEGLSLYSTDIVTEIGLEIRDVLPAAADILYTLLGEKRHMRRSELMTLLSQKVSDEGERQAAYALLLWHGVIGLHRSEDDAVYIFNVNYDLKRLMGLIEKFEGNNPPLIVNPAFVPGLELTD